MNSFLRICSVVAVFICLHTTGFAQAPVANFTISPSDSGCAPFLVTFTSTSTGSPTSYEWNFGNGNTSLNPFTATHTYNTVGTYTVSLKVTNGSGFNIKTKTITVLPAPTVNFTGSPLAGCPPLTVNFTDNSVLNVPGPATYNWNFGTGVPSTAQSPTHTFTTSGSYHITLNVKNAAGCENTLFKSQYIQVYAPPVADFTNTPVCTAPGATTFTASISGNGPYTYNWDFGDGSPAGSGSSPSHTYNTSNVYNVKLIVTDVNGCKDTVIKPVGVGSLQAGFTAPAVACVGSPAYFISNSVSAMYYFWDFGDGGTSTSTPTTHVYSTPGTFTVKLTVTDAANVCTDTISKTIMVSNGPVPAFTISPLIPCPSPDTLFFTNQSTGAVSYQWFFGDAATSTAVNPYHIYNYDSVYIITLKATDTFGCSNSISVRDTFYKMTVDVSALDPNNPLLSGYPHCIPATILFDYDSTFLYWTLEPPPGTPRGWLDNIKALPITTTSVTWDFGDGSPTVTGVSTPTHTFTSPGTFNVTATLQTSNGCTIVGSYPVTVDTLPTAAFTLSHDTICVGDTLYITDLSTGGIWSGFYIVPDYQSPDVLTLPNYPVGAYVFRHPGETIVTMKAFNNTCADSAQLPIVAIGPAAWFTKKISCDTPTFVRFKDSTTERISWRLWDFGDGTTDTSKNPEHNYASLGNYMVKLTVHDDSTGCTSTIEQPLYLYVLQADFWGHDTAICQGDTVFLSAQFSGPVYAYSYNSTPPNGQYKYPALASQWYIFPNAGLHTITMTYSDVNGCVHDTTKTDYILVADPNPNFAALPAAGCSPLHTLFIENGSNTPGAYSAHWDWTFGDNTTASIGNDSIYHTYAPGKYTVKVVVTDNVGCVDSLTRGLFIESHKTTAAFKTDDTTLCIGETVHFTNQSTSATSSTLTYSWDFGDGSLAVTTKDASHSYAQTGFYTVKLIVQDNIGCNDTLIKTNHIQITKPHASFTMSDTFALCPPLIAQFTNNTTGATTYNWKFGDGSTTAVPNPTNIYTNSGKYNVVLVATDINGCTDTAYGSAEVLGYAGGVTYTPVKGCNPLTVNFTATLTNVSNFLWDFSDGNVIPATGTTISHTYTFPGKFLPKIVFTDSAGCVNSSSGIDTIFVDDILASFSPSPLCINTPVTLKDSSFSFFSAVTGWNWNINNGQAQNNQNTISTTFPATGTYPVTLIAQNANGCRDTLYDYITILPLPTIYASADTVVCVGDAATLSGYGGVSYEWAPTTGLGCPACATTTASPVVATAYVVTGTDVHGCRNKDTVNVSLQTKTTSEVGPGGEICADSSFQLNASGAQRYVWRPAESLNDPNIANPAASPGITTTYIVLAYEGSCTADSHTVSVVVHPLPTVRASGAETIVVGNSVNLNASGTNISLYTWKPSGSLSCADCSSPVAKPTATTTYIVEVSSDFGCRAWDSVTIKVLCDQSQLFIPNTFSPNGDGNNDVFYPRGIGLQSIRSFRIYNRWGELVYERESIQLNDAASAWDGTYKGNALNPDVYVYVVEGVCDGGETMIWKGDVTLIR